MDDCPVCPKSKSTRAERSCHSPRKKRYRPVSERKRRYSPMGCESFSREDLHFSHKSFHAAHYEPCPSPCKDRCCYPRQTESGLLNTLRSSILRLFTGRKPNQLYMYSMSQLKFIEQQLDKLGDETCCIEGTIRQAQDCECKIDCLNIRCSLRVILERVEMVKCDLMCAKDCYDPCRDRCEFELICCLMERVCGLERLLRELCLQLEHLQAPSPCDACCGARVSFWPQQGCCGSCKGCAQPSERSACCKVECETGCRENCFYKPICSGPRKLGKHGSIYHPKGPCRTSSVIPVGVMLVKL